MPIVYFRSIWKEQLHTCGVEQLGELCQLKLWRHKSMFWPTRVFVPRQVRGAEVNLSELASDGTDLPAAFLYQWTIVTRYLLFKRDWILGGHFKLCWLKMMSIMFWNFNVRLCYSFRWHFPLTQQSSLRMFATSAMTDEGGNYAL